MMIKKNRIEKYIYTILVNRYLEQKPRKISSDIILAISDKLKLKPVVIRLSVKHMRAKLRYRIYYLKKSNALFSLAQMSGLTREEISYLVLKDYIELNNTEYFIHVFNAVKGRHLTLAEAFDEAYKNKTKIKSYSSLKNSKKILNLADKTGIDKEILVEYVAAGILKVNKRDVDNFVGIVNYLKKLLKQ